ncbi:trans-2,3-dihydro-3-hydroxyanthranilate isomerase [Sphingomonas sp. F9_3S_D5_B_2]
MAERTFEFVTVDVFASERFGGNPLAVFPDAHGLQTTEMQALAAEMNLSETTFVLPPENPRNTAHVRIFNRTAEMPFAGHPNVGTAFVLASRSEDRSDVLRFEELSGLVSVQIERDERGDVSGAKIDAPQPLQVIGEVDAAAVARCIGLPEGDIDLDLHRPVRATVGVEFLLVAVRPEAVTHATPDLNAFRSLAARSPDHGARLSIFLYAREGTSVHARMFAPLAGTWEDPATGSASATLGALILSLEGGPERLFDVSQGTEIGRPSRLRVHARRTDDGTRASVAGSCVPVLKGQVTL